MLLICKLGGTLSTALCVVAVADKSGVMSLTYDDTTNYLICHPTSHRRHTVGSTGGGGGGWLFEIYNTLDHAFTLHGGRFITPLSQDMTMFAL